MTHIILIGHLSLDRIELNDKVYFPVLGGAVAYAGVVLKKMNYDVTIISEIGADFPKEFLDFLKSIGINTKLISQISSYTTSYYLKYTVDGFRELFLIKKACDVDLQYLDILPSLLNPNDIVLFLPIANEIPLQYFDFFAEQDVALTALDLQGLLRKYSEGPVQIKKPNEQFLNSIRKLIPDVVKASYEEAKMFLSTAQPSDLIMMLQKETHAKYVILSLGEKGTMGLHKSKIFTIPLKKNVLPKNTTGAGDVLLSSFIGLFAQGVEFKTALEKANEIASKSVMFMDPIDIYKNLKIEPIT